MVGGTFGDASCMVLLSPPMAGQRLTEGDAVRLAAWLLAIGDATWPGFRGAVVAAVRGIEAGE